MSRILRILHRTKYRYDRQIVLNPHQFMLRPCDGHGLWVDNAFLSIRPQAKLRWYFDTFGNSIAEVTFEETSDSLLVESELLLRRVHVGKDRSLAMKRVEGYPP